MKTAPQNTTVDFEPTDVRDPTLLQDPLPLIPIKLKEIVNYNQIFGKEVIMHIDFKQLSLHPSVSQNYGVYIIQINKGDEEELIVSKLDEVQKEQKFSDMNLGNAFKQTYVSSSLTQAIRKFRSSNPKFDAKRYKLFNNQTFTITFQPFSETDLDLIMNSVLIIEGIPKSDSKKDIKQPKPKKQIPKFEQQKDLIKPDPMKETSKVYPQKQIPKVDPKKQIPKVGSTKDIKLANPKKQGK
ncbi:MAG: hypothetical protein EZS28_008885 [Streblomastix strix]|uniref:Uncharacterized protein n=1 Tax=Streblomastix strix TaxID=222440 RepID=A0A5J4WLS8_9EUKA|nr:MAG: hypothetical protein EZS28_008885 [Streblomastix strix]